MRILLQKNIHPIVPCTADHMMMISGLQSHKELFLDDEEMYSYYQIHSDLFSRISVGIFRPPKGNVLTYFTLPLLSYKISL